MKKIKVYATCFWEDDESLLNNMIKQLGFGKTDWKNIEFTLRNDFDRVIIMTAPHINCKNYQDNQAITFLTEPPVSTAIVPHNTSVVLPIYLQVPGWNKIRKTKKSKILQISPLRKPNLLSSVTSDLYDLEGHQLRLDLIYQLDQVIAEGFDLWGRNDYNNFFPAIKAYKGPIADKYDALWKYNYHIACENSFLPNYYTEKIYDPIIAQCLCFYDGCSNLEEFIDERAFIRIDAHSPSKAIETIIRSIENNVVKDRMKFIFKQKERLLYDLNPLNLIWMAVNDMDIFKIIKL
jgi:hypothetical protein